MLQEHKWGVGDSVLMGNPVASEFDGESLPVSCLGQSVETPLGPGVYTLDRNGKPRVRIELGCEKDGCLSYTEVYLGYNGAAFAFDGEFVADLRNEGFVCSEHGGQ